MKGHICLRKRKTHLRSNKFSNICWSIVFSIARYLSHYSSWKHVITVKNSQECRRNRMLQCVLLTNPYETICIYRVVVIKQRRGHKQLGENNQKFSIFFFIIIRLIYHELSHLDCLQKYILSTKAEWKSIHYGYMHQARTW